MVNVRRTRTHSLYTILIISLGLLIGIAFLTGGVTANKAEKQTLTKLDKQGRSPPLPTIYKGQEFKLDVRGSKLNFNSTVYIQRKDIPGYNLTETTVSIDQSDVTNVIETDQLPAGEKYVVSNTSSETGGNTTATFWLNKSDFDAGWANNTVNSESDNAIVDVSSKQSRPFAIQSRPFAITVQAEGIEHEQLREIFSHPAVSTVRTGTPNDVPFEALGYDPDTTGVSDIRNENTITLIKRSSANADLIANFTNLNNKGQMLSSGEYEFTFIEANTGEITSDSLVVETVDGRGEAEFGSTVYRETAGDLVTFTITPEDGTSVVQIGSPEVGFVDFLYIDAKEESPVDVTINTRLLGSNPSLSAENVYSVEPVIGEGGDDGYDVNFESAYHSPNPDLRFNRSPTYDVDMFGSNGPKTSGTYSYTEYLQEAGLIGNSQGRTDMLIRPLQPAEYPLYAGQTTNIGDPSETAVFDAETGEPNDIADDSKIVLGRPSVEAVNVFSAGTGKANEFKNIKQLSGNLTYKENGKITSGDRLVIEYQASGIFGGIVADTSNRNINFTRTSGQVDSAVIANYASSDWINLTIKARNNIANAPPAKINLNSKEESTRIITKANRDKFYIIVDTSRDMAFSNSDVITDRTEFTAGLTFDADNDGGRFRFNGSDPFIPTQTSDEIRNFPYYKQGGVSESVVSFTISEPYIEFDSINQNGNVQIPPTEEASLSGTIYYGTESDQIRIKSKVGDEYLTNITNLDTSGDGSFDVTVDLSDQEEGQRIIAEYWTQGQIVSTTEIRLNATDITKAKSEKNRKKKAKNESTGSQDPEPKSTTNKNGAGDGGEGENNNDDRGGFISNTVPGFGIPSALIAVVGVLSIRYVRR